MNREQKEVQQTFLDSEKAVLKRLEANYKEALTDINAKIASLQSRDDADLQHVIYQVEYQKALKVQVQTVLDQLHNNNFETVSEYLTESYEEGFVGTMYDLQGQGIPLVFPIDQKQVTIAIQHETKLSEDLYTRLGKDTKLLSKQIATEISRGIVNAAMYSEIARNIAAYAGISKNKAMRIARTEAHRIQCKATADAQWKAKEKGADVVKQWDASLDDKTRDTHRQLDGQIRELDEVFEVQGKKAMMPGGFGDPAEDCNCRCALLQRARWALGNDYTKWSPDAPVLISDDGTTQFVKVDAKSFTEFKGIYKDIAGQMTMNMENRNSSNVRSNSYKFDVHAPNIKDKKIRKAYDDFNTVLMQSEGNEMMVNRLIMASDIVEFVEDNNLQPVFSYISDQDIIKYNSKAPNFNLYDLNYVQAHELSHRVDMKEIHSWDNSLFMSAIEKSRKIVRDNQESIIKWFEQGGKYENDVAISDIISALSDAEMNEFLIAGHGKEYWEKDARHVPLEVFANLASIDIVGNDSKIEFETMFKELFDTYKVMVK